MAVTAADGDERARLATARAALDLIEPGMTVGLGSGRAVWHLIAAIRARWPDRPPLRAVCASRRTDELARDARLDRLELDDACELDLALDGADEIDGELGLIKGGGGALLREKLVILAARRFVVIAEQPKKVARLGERHTLPVEVVRFGWQQTRRRVRALLPDAELRTTPEGDPRVTEEGHFLLDGRIPPDIDVNSLAADLKATVGVVEHGLFLGLASAAILGGADGDVETLARRPRGTTRQ